MRGYQDLESRVRPGGCGDASAGLGSGCLAQAIADYGAQLLRIPRIERTGDSRGANGDCLRSTHGKSIDPLEREHNYALAGP